MSFLDDAVVEVTVCCGFPWPTIRASDLSVGVWAGGKEGRGGGRNSHTFHSLQGMSVIVREVKLLSRSSWDILAVDCNTAVVMYRLYNAAVNVNELSWNGVNIRLILTSEAPSVSMFMLLIVGTFVVSVRMASNSTILVLGLWQTLPCYVT